MQHSISATLLCLVPLTVVGPLPGQDDSPREQERGTANGEETPPPGLLVVVGQGDASITVVDPRTGAMRGRFDAGLRPDEVVAAPDGRSAWVMVYGGQEAGQSIIEVSLGAEPAVAGVHDLPGLARPHGCQWVGDRLWFTAEACAAIARFDPKARCVDAVLGHGGSVGHMLAVHPATGRAYVANILSQDCSVIELHDGNRRVRRVALPSPQPEGLACSPDGSQVWFGHRGDGSLSCLDTESLEVTATVPVGGIPFRLAFTGDGRLFVSEPTTSTLLEIDSEKATVARRIELPGAGTGFTLHPGGEWAAISLADRNRVALVHLASGRVVREIEVGAHPDGVAWAVPGGSAAAPSSHGPGFMGLYPARVPEGQGRPESEPGGFLVRRLHPDGGAVAAGIEVGDVVETLDGEPVDGPVALGPLLRGRRAGEVVTLGLWRSGESIEVEVTLASRPLW